MMGCAGSWNLELGKAEGRVPCDGDRGTIFFANANMRRPHILANESQSPST
jgi:hypothetical protein